MSYIKPGGNSRFVLNRAGLAQLAKSTQSTAMAISIGKALLPRIESYGGRFTQGYDVQAQQVEGTAGARVGTDYPFAHWDEWGNIYRPARAPLRRALAAAGLLSRTRMSGKP